MARREFLVEPLKKRYIELFNNIRPVKQETLEAIENKLGITLPEDFKLIAAFYDGYESPGNYIAYSFKDKGPGWNLVEQNIELRTRIKMPKNWLAFNEPEISFVVMNLEDGSVYIIDPMDIESLFEGEQLRFTYDKFDHFIEFFSFLLDEEENDRSD